MIDTVPCIRPEADSLAHAAPPRQAMLLGLPADVAIGDWDVLLSAVKARLRLTVGELQAATPEPRAQDAASRVRAQVLECVAALDQLHITLTNELGRCQQLE